MRELHALPYKARNAQSFVRAMSRSKKIATAAQTKLLGLARCPQCNWKEFKYYKQPECCTDSNHASATKLLAMCALGNHTDKRVLLTPNSSNETRHVTPADKTLHSLTSPKTAPKACQQPCSSDSCPHFIASVQAPTVGSAALQSGSKSGRNNKKGGLRHNWRVLGRPKKETRSLSPSGGKGVGPTPTAHTLVRASALPRCCTFACIPCHCTSTVCWPACKAAVT